MGLAKQSEYFSPQIFIKVQTETERPVQGLRGKTQVPLKETDRVFTKDSNGTGISPTYAQTARFVGMRSPYLFSRTLITL